MQHPEIELTAIYPRILKESVHYDNLFCDLPSSYSTPAHPGPEPVSGRPDFCQERRRFGNSEIGGIPYLNAVEFLQRLDTMFRDDWGKANGLRYEIRLEAIDFAEGIAGAANLAAESTHQRVAAIQMASGPIGRI